MPPAPVANWVARPPVAMVPLVGRFVRVDPIDFDRDVDLLWDALGGNDGSLNERLHWWGMKDFMSPGDLSAVLRSIDEKEGWCVCVFRDLKHDRVVGMASCISTNAEHGTTEVGYVVHGAALARTPAATEAHYLLAKHAFEGLGYRRLEWKCDSNNAASGAAAERYGYTFEGRFRQHRVTARGTNRDTDWYSIIDAEWPERKAAFERWLDPANFDEGGKQRVRLRDLRSEQVGA